MSPALVLGAALGVLLVLLEARRVARGAARRARTARVALVEDERGNEALVVRATLSGMPTLFLVDTAYAGAPVLSKAFLAVQARARGAARPSTGDFYRASVRALERRADGGKGGGGKGADQGADDQGADDQSADGAVARMLLATGRCRAFTSGCTMRLMGIGATSEAHADMLLCPALRLDGVASDRDAAPAAAADVLVTHPLPQSTHILTIDYLLHRAPCVLCPREGTLALRLTYAEQLAAAPAFEFHAARLLGGAFVVPMHVGGARLDVVLDTGAAAPLSLSPRAVRALRSCRATAHKAVQGGVNGERVCSDVVYASVRVGSHALGDVQVFANSHDVEGADGYAGMGLLRAFDLWFEPRRVGLRRSGLPPRASAGLTSGSCGERPPCGEATAA